MFNIGDLIIGKPDNGYSYTCEGTICKVVRKTGSRNLIGVICVKSDNPFIQRTECSLPEDEKMVFEVWSSRFELLKLGKKNNKTWI
ncbi:MAG: hypothetical protein IIV48_07770 [Clostridium sp.]|nr:hypothetical protein [Clostridium sp.]